MKRTPTAACLLLATLALAAQGFPPLPQIDPVIATMKGAPKDGIGLSLLAGLDPQAASIRWVRAVYQCKDLAAAVEVYVSVEPRQFPFGKPNVAGLTGAGFGYALLAGKPCYLQTRKSGQWFLFVMPDDTALDVAGFILRFGDCYGFFESRLPGAGPADYFPAFVGTLQGVR